jgi:GWxTD domain-containing protein
VQRFSQQRGAFVICKYARATFFRKWLTISLLLASSSSLCLAAQRQTVRVFHGPYQKWLDEDVRWIITDQERADFKKLLSDKQPDPVIDAFIEEFWERHNPTPGSPENKFKEEHYQRIAYTNQHFAEEIPGWKTDRGRFYIMYGPPEKVERQPPAGKPQPEGSGPKKDFGSEVWHWEYIEGLGHDVTLRFVDTCGCGEYRLAGGDAK